MACRAVPDAAPVRRRAVRVPGRGRPRCGSPTASRGGVSGRLRPAGLMLDPETGRRRTVHALIFTAVVSRHMFVWLTFRADAGRGDRRLRGGVGVLRRGVQGPDPGQPQAGGHQRRRGQPDASAWAGWTTPSTRVRHRPRPGPLAEGQAPGRAGGAVRARQLLGRGDFLDLADAQARAEHWCRVTAGMRIHGTTQRSGRPRFRHRREHLLLPAPDGPYDVPVFTKPKVHRDRHVEVAKALYSVPGELIGQHLRRPRRLRAGQALLTAGGWSRPTRGSRPAAGPPTRRTCPRAGRLRAARRRPARDQAATAGSRSASTPSGCSTTRCPGPGCAGLPAARPGPPLRRRPVDTACARALDLDVVDVKKIARMLEQALEKQPALAPAKVVGGPARFARDNTEFRAGQPAQGGAS